MKNKLIPLLFLIFAAGHAAGATYTVTNTNDSGAGSLRSAVWAADATTQDDVVVFDITGCPDGVCTIVLTSGQLTIRAASSIGTLAITNTGGPRSLIVSGNNNGLVFLALLHSKLSITGITVEGGSTGGISASGGDLTISNSVIRRCGGSGIAGWGSFRVEGSEISENTSQFGGGIQFYGGELVIDRSEIKQNGAGRGGGIRLHGDGSISIRDSTIADNFAEHWGGGMDIFPGYGADVTLINSTLSGNTAFGAGGALSLTGGGKYGWTSVTLTNTTVTNNSASVGGGIDGYGGVATRNSIVAGNSATVFPDINPSLATVYNLGNNILEVASPLLGPLEHNGGPTRTHSLRPGSPAINAGNNCVRTANGCGDGNPALPLDQRGYNRVGNVDVGAFERTSRSLFDFDRDGRSDVSVFRPINSVWYLNRSTEGFSATQFGLASDAIVPADYDGDGRTDIAVFRDGTWWVMRSSNETVVQAFAFGQPGDLPVPADYTGDGRDELGVYRNGQWWSLDLSNNQSSLTHFGLAGDKPVPADYDGDARADQAVYRNGEWHLNRSTQGPTALSFGLPTDRPVVGDYDADGKADLAVYRDGTWYLQRSTAGFSAFQWGLSTDIPAGADYDGDGKTDATVYRDGTWYQLRSTGGVFVQQFGLSGDLPIAASFIR